MRILLAGMNVDMETIQELQKQRPDMTPETISAAYARISRDPRPIDELRRDSRKEIEKSRKSNQTIIFGLGHSSVAEHAVFNIDLIGVSRLAVEEIEKCRLASYTEKSQRYITLEGDYVFPEEIKHTHYENAYKEIIDLQNKAYERYYAVLKPYFKKKHPEYTDTKRGLNTLEGWAKEDARYAISLATEAQLGMTVNARNLERMIVRLAAHPLAEIRGISSELRRITSDLVPSLIKYTDPTDMDTKTRPELEVFSQKHCDDGTSKNPSQKDPFFSTPSVILTGACPDIDKRIAAALLFSSSNKDYAACTKIISELSPDKLERLFRDSFRHLHSYDPLLREFENADLTYEMTMSASCFAQMKRHRMATILTQPYDPSLGYVLPDSLRDTGFSDDFLSLLATTQDLYEKLLEDIPHSSFYILPNAVQRRVFMKVNLRELNHISRLREDIHAQWEIRQVAADMVVQAREKAPLSLMITCGKDRFEEVKRSIFAED